MSTSRSRPSPGPHRSQRSLPREGLRWGLHRWAPVALVLSLVAVPAGTASAADAPTATELADQVYPGVQLIETDFTATLSIPEPIMNQAALNRLEARLKQQAISGAIDPTEAAVIQAFVDDVSKNPFTYFQPGTTSQTEEDQLSGFGTGWVVTHDGYMVTAAHVVSPDPDEIKKAFSTQALTTFTKDAIAELEKGEGHFTADQATALGGALTTWAAKYLTVSNLKSTVSAQLGVAVAGFKKSQKGHPVEVVSTGEPYPGKDVAILKLDGETHLPTLPVGADADVSTGSTLYVAGYPAASTFFASLSKDSQVQPTVTQGPLTAIKSNEKGTPIFQTQAPASPGNSGGPVLDGAGKVVGILVASAVGDQGVALEGQEFAIPISVVTEKLNEKNIKPDISDTTTIYDKALTEYGKRHYKNALPLFQKVRALYPGHPYADDFITKSTAAIDAGKDETPSDTTLWIAIGAGAVAVVVLVVVVVLLRRRRRKGGTGPGTPPGWSGQPYPQPGYPQQGYPTGGYPAGGPGPQPGGYPTPPPGQQPGQQPGGYPPAPQPGYPGQQPGYPPSQQPGGYPPPQQPGGYPPSQQPGGYPPPQQPGGYPTPPGYPQQPGTYPPP